MIKPSFGYKNLTFITIITAPFFTSLAPFTFRLSSLKMSIKSEILRMNVKAINNLT